MTDLKPCPFCGGEPKPMSGGPGCAWLKCDCGIETTDGSLPRIIEIWNTRAKPKVKPLVWRISHGVSRAKTPFGDYMVGVRTLTLPLPMAPQQVHEDEGAAKAAAQADYERRILEALEENND